MIRLINYRTANLILVLLLLVGTVGLVIGRWPLLTPDQRGHRLLVRGEFAAAAEVFADPMWRGAALFKAGEFDSAAGVYAGLDTPESALNQGNALVMLGKYEAAIARYNRALELRPDWRPAADNREIAVARAALLEQEGGEGTGGKLGADDVVMSESKSPQSGDDKEVVEQEPMSDVELRAHWLRKVQTNPADFLRSKFARQATREADTTGGTP